MTTIEDQLRRYSERLETTVPTSSTRARPMPRRSRRATAALVAVAAGALVTAGLLWASTEGNDQASDLAVVGPSSTEAPMPAQTESSDGPGVREQFSQVWTGRELIVFGGYRADATAQVVPVEDGHAYDPTTNTWRHIAAAPGPRSGHDAVWLDGAMYVVGGTQQAVDVYDPATDTWRRLPDAPIDLANGHEGFGGTRAVAAGDRLVVWSPAAAAGAVFDPRSQRWSLLPPTEVGSGEARLYWTGQQLIIVTANGPSTLERPATLWGAVVRLDANDVVVIPPLGITDAVDGYNYLGTPRVDSTAWIDGRLLAWDAACGPMQAWEYRPGAAAWARAPAPPIASCESYPPAIVTDTFVLAYSSCGPDASVLDSGADAWRTVETLPVPSSGTVWTGTELLGWVSPRAGGPDSEPYLWRQTVPS